MSLKLNYATALQSLFAVRQILNVMFLRLRWPSAITWHSIRSWKQVRWRLSLSPYHRRRYSSVIGIPSCHFTHTNT